MSNNNHPAVITTTEALVALCDRLARADHITVDTEFMRDNTYWPILCLIQVADDKGAFAIDPLANGLDLSPFYALMTDDSTLKIFHACRQDLEIFYNATGKVPSPIFDTQLAAMVCGFGDSPGYETLVNRIVKQKLDKSARFTDWARRPLTDRQIDYALGDVTHLRDIFRYLMAKLEKSGRGPWLDEEMAILTDPATYKLEPEAMWLRMKTRSNKPRFLAIVRELAAWREREAQTRDIPRNRIAKDEVLLEVAAHPPNNPDQLSHVRGISPKMANGPMGKGILDAVRKAQTLADDALPEVPSNNGRGPSAPPVADLMKVLLKTKSQESGVASRLIANSADVEAIALDDEADVPALKGWRRDLYGRHALDLKKGRLAVTADARGNLKFVELS